MDREDIILSLKDFMHKNKEKYNIISLGIFGSVAKNSMNDQSDIDIVVKLKTPDMLNLIGIKQDFDDKLRQSVDIIRYRDKMNKLLKRRIDKDAVYV